MEALSDPQGAIVDRGGRIFLAVQEGEAVGCCALDHGPGVGSGFNSDVSVGGKVAGEVREGFPGDGKVVAMEDSSGVVEDYGFDDFLVQIERGKWHNEFTPHPWREDWKFLGAKRTTAGDPATRDAVLDGPRGRAKKARAKRHLPIRTRSSTGWTGRAARYDGGLEAHKHNRPAPRCSALLSMDGRMFFTPCPKPGEQ